jgi:micrococcal nuclease
VASIIHGALDEGRPCGENLSLAIVRAGRSPYFTKYGRSRLYHAEFLEAERMVRAV